jgi:hypothetical protein
LIATTPATSLRIRPLRIRPTAASIGEETDPSDHFLLSDPKSLKARPARDVCRARPDPEPERI